jgi:hypothetical protein
MEISWTQLIDLLRVACPKTIDLINMVDHEYWRLDSENIRLKKEIEDLKAQLESKNNPAENKKCRRCLKEYQPTKVEDCWCTQCKDEFHTLIDGDPALYHRVCVRCRAPFNTIEGGSSYCELCEAI